MYRVVVPFADLKDGKHEYKVGDTFPRNGLKVPDARIEELSTGKNRRGVPLIVLDEPKTEAKAEKPARSRKERK